MSPMSTYIVTLVLRWIRYGECCIQQRRECLNTACCAKRLKLIDLRARTGLSHPVVVQQVAQLKRAGLVRFGSPLGGATGRPRIPISFNWEYRRLLAVEMHLAGVTLQAMNLAGQPVSDPVTRPAPAWTQDGIIEALSDGIRRMQRAPGPAWAGIGLVLPAAIAADRRTLVYCQGVPEWTNDALGDRLSRQCGMPVFLYNEAEALARSVWATKTEPVRSIMAISVRTNARVMMALMSANCHEFVTDGPFGAIGHIPCGAPCLDAALAAGQPAQRGALIQALARTAADMVTVFNPGRLVMQGDAAWSDEDTAAVHTALQGRAFPCAGADVQFETRPHRAQESLLGIASAVTGQLLNLRNGLLNDWVVPVE